MSKLKIVILILLIVIAGFIGFFAYVGMFATPEAYEKITGPYTIVYEEYIGAYKDTGPVFDKLYKALENDGIKTTRALGIYYDNPTEVPEEKLKSHCGVIIEENDLEKVPSLKNKYNVMQIKQYPSIVVEFPIKNTLSFMIGPMRCYPVLMKHAKEKGYKPGMTYELYDQPNKKILYVMEIVK